MSLENQDVMLQHLIQSRNDNQHLKSKIKDISKREEGLGSTLIAYLIHELGSTNDFGKSVSLRNSLLDAVYQSEQGGEYQLDTSAFQIPKSRRTALVKKFLSKIEYDNMYDRELMVAEAHHATFRWIFETKDSQQRPWVDFGQWLKSNQQLYWITGKAGSGKSTLMKYITHPISSRGVTTSGKQQLRCTEHLLQWAKGRPLLVASFYFWASGSKMQTSKEGLYRTLLSQLLKARPDAIQHVAADRWEALCLFNEDPRPLKETELRGMLIKAIVFVQSTMALCIFIDGLDEFDGQHGELIQFVMETIEKASVKICVASRPWTIFEDTLKDKPSLLLEDLTYDDIKEYVATRFHSDAEFKSLQKDEPGFANELIENVVRKASGDFLWVKLVVSSLLAGVSAGDRVSDFQRRLDALPSDLEKLYDAILDNLDPFYFEHAAQYFFLMLACAEPPDSLLFSFADEDDPQFALKLPVKSLGSQAGRRTRIIRRRLNSRCKGLLAVPKLPSDVNGAYRPITIQYLHRTVKDYIEQSAIQKKFDAMIKSPFDPYLRLCAGALASMKSQTLLRSRAWYETMSHCMHYASRVAPHNAASMIAILDELQKIFNTNERVFDDYTSFKIVVGISDNTFLGEERFGNCILSLAVKCGVLEYVQSKTLHGCLVSPNKGYALITMHHHLPFPEKKSWWNPTKYLDQFSHRSDAISPQWPLLLDATPSIAVNPAIVEALLKRGADPNFVIRRPFMRSSIWIETLAFVTACSSLEYPFRIPELIEILEHMLRYGANTNKKTIRKALKLVQFDHLTEFDDENAVVSVLQKALRAAKYGDKKTDFSLSSVFVKGRRGMGMYNISQQVYSSRLMRGEIRGVGVTK